MMLKLVTAPAAEPITAAEAKTHDRIDGTDSDTLLALYITAARQMTERMFGLALVTQTWDFSFDAFPPATRFDPWGAIPLPLPPLQSVTSISYLDGNGDSQTVSTSVYDVHANPTQPEPGRITLGYGQSWPDVLCIPEAITVRFVAGFGAASAVPEDIKTALKFMVAHWFENREPASQAGRIEDVPFTFQALMGGYRQFAF